VNKKPNVAERALPEYSAPEVLKGNHSKLSDAFSFGLVELFVFTGKDPTSNVELGNDKRKALSQYYEGKDYIHDFESLLKKSLHKVDKELTNKLLQSDGPIFKYLKEEKSRSNLNQFRLHFEKEDKTESTFIHDLLFPRPQSENKESTLGQVEQVTGTSC